MREALAGRQRTPLELFVVRDGKSPRLQEVVQEALRREIPVRYRERKDVDRLAGHGHHQGLVLRVTPFAYAEFDDLLHGWRAAGANAFFLILDGLTDPHNFAMSPSVRSPILPVPLKP
ncbi:MAG: RNA methyltransferase substrate-binding domain-containing protein [Desulfuromonadaceae bacterium]